MRGDALVCLQKVHERDLILGILRLNQPALPRMFRFHRFLIGINPANLPLFLRGRSFFQTEPLPKLLVLRPSYT